MSNLCPYPVSAARDRQSFPLLSFKHQESCEAWEFCSNICLSKIGSPYCTLHGCHQKLSSLVSDSALLLRSQSLKTCDTFTCVLSENLDPQIPDSDGYKVGQWVHESPFLRQSNMVLGHTLLGALTGGFSRSALQRGVFGG